MGKNFTRKIMAILIIVFISIMSASCRKQTDSTSTAAKSSAKAGTTMKSATKTASGTIKNTGTLAETGIDENDSSSVAENSDEESNPYEDVGDDVLPAVIPEMDLGGATVKIGYAYESQIPINDPANQPLYVTWLAMREVEKRLNCTIQCLVSGGSNAEFKNECMANALAGTEYRDILLNTDSLFYPWAVQQGYLQPLSKLFESGPEQYQACNQAITLWKNEQYAIRQPKTWVGDEKIGTVYPQNTLCYNREMFARDGLTDPQDYFDDFLWTWDMFLNDAIALTRDVNGDGKTDEFGVAGPATLIFPALLWSNGSTLVKEDENGIGYFSGYTPNTLQAFQFVSDLYNVYKVVNEGAYATGTAGMVFCLPNQRIRWMSSAIDYGIMAIPIGPSVSDKRYVSYMSTYTGGTFFLPVRNTDPKAAFNVACMIQLLQTVDYDYKKSASDYMVSLGYKNPRDQEFYAKLFPNYGKITGGIDRSAMCGLTNDATALYNKLKTQQVPVAAGLDSIASLAQQKIADTYK